MEYGQPVSAGGRAQGLALELGTGRIVILGDAGTMRATFGWCATLTASFRRLADPRRHA
jgi:hypothetical protein